MSDDETAPEMLERLGADAMLWAQEFSKTAVKLGYSEMDEGWLISWFANAIENCDVIRCNPIRAQLAAVTEERDYVMTEGLFSADQIRILKAERDAAIEERDRMREALEESRQSWERVDKAHSFRVHESEMRLIKIFDIEKENARLRDALKPFAAMMDAEHMLSLVKALDSDWTRCIVKIGDLRRARAALEGVPEPPR